MNKLEKIVLSSNTYAEGDDELIGRIIDLVDNSKVFSSSVLRVVNLGYEHDLPPQKLLDKVLRYGTDRIDPKFNYGNEVDISIKNDGNKICPTNCFWGMRDVKKELEEIYSILVEDPKVMFLFAYDPEHLNEYDANCFEFIDSKNKVNSLRGYLRVDYEE